MPTWPAFNGAGALFSTTNDMMRFLAWNMGEVNSDLNDVLEDLHKPRFALNSAGGAVGLRWHLSPTGKPGSSIELKDGKTLGDSSYISFSAEAKSGIVILTNSARCPAVRLGTRVLTGPSGQETLHDPQ